ncbi:hypothetical protein [Luteitalea pratensis]|nr:hypothetical protein [Luteitalea pratensis]
MVGHDIAAHRVRCRRNGRHVPTFPRVARVEEGHPLVEDLDEASRLAVRELVEFLMSEKKLSREDAYMLCSLATSLRVTQAVDATKGIHAILAKSIFTAQ